MIIRNICFIIITHSIYIPMNKIIASSLLQFKRKKGLKQQIIFYYLYPKSLLTIVELYLWRMCSFILCESFFLYLFHIMISKAPLRGRCRWSHKFLEFLWNVYHYMKHKFLLFFLSAVTWGYHMNMIKIKKKTSGNGENILLQIVFNSTAWDRNIICIHTEIFSSQSIALTRSANIMAWFCVTRAIKKYCMQYSYLSSWSPQGKSCTLCAIE